MGDDSEPITLERVAYELKCIQKVCGPTSEHPLLAIRWETDYTFESGVRVPRWRAELGELCCLIAETHDVGRIVITCSRDGHFRNKGYIIDPVTGMSHVLFH